MFLHIFRFLLIRIIIGCCSMTPVFASDCGQSLHDGWEAKVQVGDNAYGLDYLKPKRWMAIHNQIATVAGLTRGSILEVGPGPGVFKFTLERLGSKVTTVDIDERTRPDIVGSITDLPIEDNTYDVVVAFQVLEHLPYELFVESLKEMSRVAKGYVVVSIPDVTPSYRLTTQENRRRAKTTFVEEKSFIPTEEHVWDGEHYWEVGKIGYPQEKIRKDIEDSGLTLDRDFRVPEHPWHHFYVIRL